MRVLFDGFWWDEGPIANRTVQRQIIEEWVSNFPSDMVAIAGRGPLIGTPAGVETLRTRAPLQAITNAFELPRLARRWKADVVIAHNFASPTRRALSVVFIHDLMFLDRPEWFTPAENAYFRLMKVLARRADVITTSSRAEAARINRHVRSTRVEPVGLSLSPELATSEPAAPNPSPHFSSFALAVGRLNVRKNLALLIEAALDSASFTSERPLLIVGESSGKSAELGDRARQAIEDGVVVFTGRIPDGELRWLYSNTDLFLFMSLDEGFGLPCLEAAYFGAPAIVSDIPVFREVLGEAGNFVDPQDKEAIARAIRDRFESPPVPGLASDISEYTWSGVVRRMRSVVEREVVI